MTTDADYAAQADKHFRATTVKYADWQAKVKAGVYTPPDGSATEWGQGFASLAKIGAVTPPPPPPNGWTVAPPQAPITTINNPPGIGVNVTPKGVVVKDTVIHGGGDSAVIFELGADNGSVERCQFYDVAAGNAVSWGKHAVYAKAHGLTVSDLTATGSKYASDGLSCRFPGFLGQRCQLDGFAFPLAVFADDLTPGQILWQHIRGSGTNSDTGIWLDVNLTNKMVYDIVCDDVQLTGPGKWFLRANAAVFAGTVTIRNGCTWNGKAVTAAMVGNVPASKLTILP